MEAAHCPHVYAAEAALRRFKKAHSANCRVGSLHDDLDILRKVVCAVHNDDVFDPAGDIELPAQQEAQVARACGAISVCSVGCIEMGESTT